MMYFKKELIFHNNNSAKMSLKMSVGLFFKFWSQKYLHSTSSLKIYTNYTESDHQSKSMKPKISIFS